MSIYKKVVAGLSATTIALSVVAPVSTVSANNAEVEAANKLAANGIIKNQDNVANYNLDKEITRREFIKVVDNLAGLEVTDTCEGKFEDLPATDWGCKYAEAALAKGFIKGNAKYNPNMNVSKWEAMKMVLKAKGLDKSEGFEAYQAAYVDAAVKAGIIDEAFTDYTTSAKRGWLFVAGANTIVEEDVDGEDPLCALFGTCDTDNGDTTVEEGDKDGDDNTTIDQPASTEDELQVSLNPKNPENGTRVPMATPRVPFAVFDVTAGSEDVEVKTAMFEADGFGKLRNIKDVAIYNADGEKVTRSRSVNSDKEVELSFKNYTVKAGTTETLTVSATIDDTDVANGDTFKLNLVEMKASSTVEGAEFKGTELVAVKISGKGQLEIKADVASRDVTIGETSKLAGFKLKNENGEEDISLKTIRFRQTGSIDEDEIVDLELLADGKVVASDLSFNGEYVTANLGEGYTFDKDKSSFVYFELKGKVIAGPTETVGFEIEETSDVYATGEKTGYNVNVNALTSSFDLTDNGGADLKVEGANVAVTFTKNEKDEVSKDTSDFAFGTIKFESFAANYNLKSYKITLTTDAASARLPEDVKLGNVSAEKDPKDVTPVGNVYTLEFKDIFLKKGESKELTLTADIPKTAVTGDTYQFNLNFVKDKFELEDEDNNESYKDTKDLSDIFSNYTGFESRKVALKEANAKVTSENIADENVVLGDSTLLAFKGKLEAGSAEDVKVNTLTFTKDATNAVADLDTVVAKAILKIGSESFESTDISASTIRFTGLSKVVKGGSNNRVDFELSVKFKKADASAITENTADKVKLNLSSADAEGTETGSNVTIAAATGSNTITLTEKGTLSVKVDVEQDDANIVFVHTPRNALAGQSNVVLTKVELDSEKEAAKIKDLVFTSEDNQGANAEDSFTNVRLVKSDLNTVIANGNTETFGTDAWKVSFEDISGFDVDTEGKTVIYVVADVKSIDEGKTGGNAKSGAAIQLNVATTAGTSSFEGVDSAKEYTVGAGLTVPAVTSSKVTVVASDVASIAVNKKSTTLTGGSADVAEIVVTPKSSSNINEADKTIKSFVKEITISNLRTSGLDLAVGKTVTVKVYSSKDSNKFKEETLTVVTADTLPALPAISFDLAQEAQQIEIDGETKLLVKVSGTDANTNRAPTASFDIDRKDIKFDDGAKDVDTVYSVPYNKASNVTIQ